MIPSTYTGQIWSADTSSATYADSTSDSWGQDTFLKLLMAQVTNQNPLDPMDNQEFVAQMAQFTQVEQLTKIANSMGGLEDIEKLLTENQILNYLGKEVTIDGTAVVVTDGVAGKATFEIPDTDAYITAYVTNQDGQVVAMVDMGLQQEGGVRWTWDARDWNGQVVEDGVYNVNFVASDPDGNPVTINEARFTGVVTGYEVDPDTGQYYLRLGGEYNGALFSLSQIVGVSTYTPPAEEETEGEGEGDA